MGSMEFSRVAQLACVLVLASRCVVSFGLQGGGRRSLKQATVLGATSVRTPDGTRTLFHLHAVGTQNYSAANDGTYVSTGSTAELFDNTFKKGAHYVDVSGVPVWEVHDNSEVVQGSVKGRAVTKVAKKREAWDGGFGSVDSVLYVAYEAKGWLAEVTYIELRSPFGGVVPKGMHALPAHANVIDNKELAIPYQADYVLLTGGLPYALEGGKERAPAFQRHLHHPMTKDRLTMRKTMSREG